MAEELLQSNRSKPTRFARFSAKRHALKSERHNTGRMAPASEPSGSSDCPRLPGPSSRSSGSPFSTPSCKSCSSGHTCGRRALARRSPAIPPHSCRSRRVRRMSLPTSTSPPEIARVAPGSPADANQVVPHSTLLAQALAGDPQRTVRFDERLSTEAGRLAAWRDLYWVGCARSGRLDISPRPTGRRGSSRWIGQRHWRSPASGWARRHLGMIVQMIVFTGAARAAAPDAQLRPHRRICACWRSRSAPSAVADRCSARSGVLPFLRQVLTVFAWVASPLAFPTIALAILYFPTRSRLLDRYPWLHAVPLLAAAPLVGPALMTASLSGGCRTPQARWRSGTRRIQASTTPRSLRRSGSTSSPSRKVRIATASTTDANERRRIRMALYTAVPGVLAYAVQRRHSDRGAALRHRRPGVSAARCGSCSMASCCCPHSAWSTPSASRTCSDHASCCGAACSTRSRTAR